MSGADLEYAAMKARARVFPNFNVDAARLEQLGDLASLSDQFKTIVVPLSGDESGVTDTLNIKAAVASLDGRGRVELLPGVYHIKERIILMQGESLRGQGGGYVNPVTTIKCHHADAGISFGTRLAGGDGGDSGGFCVDADNTATLPLYVGLCVNRSFSDMNTIWSEGSGIVLQNTQNCGFFNCHFTNSDGPNMWIQDGSSNNHFFKSNPSASNEGHILFGPSGDPLLAELPQFPYDNHVWGGIAEYDGKTYPGPVNCEYGVKQVTGDMNGIHWLNIAMTDNDVPCVGVNQGSFVVEGGWITGNVIPLVATGFKVDFGARLSIYGSPSINGVKNLFDVDGFAYVEGYLRENLFEEWNVGAGYVYEKAEVNNAIIATIPLASNLFQDLDDENQNVGNGAFWVFNPALYVPAVSDRRRLKWRVCGTFASANPGDLYVIQLVSFSNPANSISGSGVASGLPFDTYVSPWYDAPTEKEWGNTICRNNTSVSGKLLSCWIEVAVR